MSDGQLQLQTFGGLGIERGGMPVGGAAARRRSLALLAYVAVHGDLGVARDAVLGRFWPDSDDAHARNNLKQITFALRRELGVEIFTPGGLTLRIDRGRLGVDALDFADALDRNDLEGAVALYRGPFLEGVFVPGLDELERWVERERERFAWACGRALESLAETAARAGDHGRAVAAWRRRAAQDPLSTHGTAGLMRALRDAGDRTAALEQWRVHELLVRDELGAEPDTSLVALADEIRRSLTPTNGVAAIVVDAPPPAPEAPPRAGPAPGAHTGRPERTGSQSVSLSLEHAIARLLEHAGTRATAPTLADHGWRDFVRPDHVRPWWHARPSLVAVVLAAVIALASPVALHRRAGASAAEVADSPTLVAVLPFTLRGQAADPDRVGQAIADLVSIAVHGAGDWRTVPPSQLLADVAAATPGGITSAEAGFIAHRYGAGRYVIGDVVRDGPRVHLAASLHDARGAHAVLAQASADGVVGELDQLTARLVMSLLGQQLAAPRDRLARVAAGSTGSLAALKAWLVGESLYGDSRYTEAAESFERAIALDSTYALAYYRLADATSLLGDLPRARAAADRAAVLGDRLPDPERRLLRAWRDAQAGDVTAAERQYEALLDEEPDHAEGWFRLAELRFHANPTRGRSVREARPAFERVVALDRDHVEALVYLARIASLDGRSADADTLARRARAASPDGPTLELRAVRAFALGEGLLQQRALRALLRRPGRAAESAVDVAIYQDDVDGSQRFAQSLLGATSSRAVTSLGRRLEALTAAAHGQAERADAAFDSLATLDVEVSLRLQALLASQPFLGTSPRALRALRARLADRWAPAADDDDPVRASIGAAVHHHRIGLVSAALGDGAALRREIAGLRSSATRDARSGATTRALAASLAARAALLDGRLPEALQQLDAARLPEVAAHPALVTTDVADRYLRAEVLRQLGRDAEAMGWYGSIAERASYELPWLAPSQLRLGELHAKRGDTAEAALHYRRFLALWQSCDPSLRPLTTAVAATVARSGAPTVAVR